MNEFKLTEEEAKFLTSKIDELNRMLDTNAFITPYTGINFISTLIIEWEGVRER